MSYTAAIQINPFFFFSLFYILMCTHTSTRSFRPVRIPLEFLLWHPWQVPFTCNVHSSLYMIRSIRTRQLAKEYSSHRRPSLCRVLGPWMSGLSCLAGGNIPSREICTAWMCLAGLERTGERIWGIDLGFRGRVVEW